MSDRKASDAAYYQRNKERILARQAAYHVANKEAILTKHSARRVGRENELAAALRVYRAANPDRQRDANRKYSTANRSVKNAAEAKRRAAKLRRTPPWANLEAIAAFYRACPEGMQVDHIYPLQGRLVSGLHVLENLQYLTPHDNAVKGNRHA